jgi:hypothetical protein
LYDFGDGSSDSPLERDSIDRHALLLGVHHPDQIFRARQAPCVRREEPVGAALHDNLLETFD